MERDKSKTIEIRTQKHKKEPVFSSRHQLGANRGELYQELTLSMILSALYSRLLKLLIALKYWFFRLVKPVFGKTKFPWFKIGLALLVVFFLTKKDIQFSFNLKAPLSKEAQSDKPVKTSGTDKMSFVQSLFPIGSNTNSEQFKMADLSDLDEEKVTAYIKRFKKVAVAEAKKFKIPASLLLAQGLLESHAGSHSLAKKNNNHFALCFNEGAFNSAWECWRAHSVFLEENYPELFEVGGTYKKWASGLEKMNYCRDKNYDKKLIKAIEEYQMFLLDED